jgi:hypothetical protein
VYAVSADHDSRNNIAAVLEPQAHALWLVRQADQPVIQLDTLCWYGRGQETLESRSVKGQVRRAYLMLIPLPYRMGPQELAIPPAAELQSWRHVRDLRQIDTKTLQEAGRITADRDPGPDFPKLGVLLENLHRYRLLQEAPGQSKATNAPAHNGDVTRTGHILRPSA